MLGSLAKSTRRSLAARARAGDLSPAAPAAEPQKYVWQRLGRDGAIGLDTTRYEGSDRSAVAMLQFEPRFALDVGCFTGAVGESIKKAHPGCKMWGIEPNARAAELAKGSLDKVIVGTFEAVDWAAQGITAGEIDTVFLLDVLEHMYNPWRTLQTLRRLVSQRAQILISLPNVRNMYILRDLMNGYWRYRDIGLLDSTHIRFFTRHEALRLIYQTGFRVATYSFSVHRESFALYQQRKDQPFPQRIDFERGSLVIEDLAELESFAASQHIFLAHPAQRHELSADEATLIDEPHPETFALGGDSPGTL